VAKKPTVASLEKRIDQLQECVKRERLKNRNLRAHFGHLDGTVDKLEEKNKNQEYEMTVKIDQLKEKLAKKDVDLAHEADFAEELAKDLRTSKKELAELGVRYAEVFCKMKGILDENHKLKKDLRREENNNFLKLGENMGLQTALNIALKALKGNELKDITDECIEALEQKNK